MEIFPAIDMRGGRVVRLIQGDYDRSIDYANDPVETAKGFVQAGARWGHIVDLDGARTGQASSVPAIRRLLESTDLNIQVGGGIRTEETIREMLAAGAARVIVGTRALEDWGWFERIARSDEFEGRVVLGLDARDGMVATHGWTERTKLSAMELAARINDWSIAAIVYTDIARDGMLTGPNFEQTEALAASTSIPVIASGGVAEIAHVRRLKDSGVAGTIIGRALYEGTIDLAEAIETARS